MPDLLQAAIYWEGTQTDGEFTCLCGREVRVLRYRQRWKGATPVVRCPACERCFQLSCHIEMWPVTTKEAGQGISHCELYPTEAELAADTERAAEAAQDEARQAAG